jgi:phospholipase C
MMENHSFDHLLGSFPSPIGTLAAEPRCLPNPDSRHPPQYCTTLWQDQWSITPCPNHTHADVMQQIYGRAEQAPPFPDPAPMNGFLANYPGHPGDLMGGFAPGALPTLAALATDFTVCTHWFSSIPGPTGPNRLFVHCASSGGYAGTAYRYEDMPPRLAKLPSIFDKLAAAGLTWQIYHQDPSFATELVLDTVKAQPSALPPDPCFLRFQRDVLAGRLANYVFLTPTLPNSQHDSWDARMGDILINCVYSTLLDSPLWESTLLLITYDEHGGHFDHVPPPLSYRNDAGRRVTIQNPDGIRWDRATWGDVFSTPEFDFTCLGVRVPALLVSAYTPAGVDATVYEHASISATLHELWGLETLTKRDASASSFLKNVHPAARRTADQLPRPPVARIDKPH